MLVSCGMQKKRRRARHFVFVVATNKAVAKAEWEIRQSTHKRRLGRGIAWPLAQPGSEPRMMMRGVLRARQVVEQTQARALLCDHHPPILTHMHSIHSLHTGQEREGLLRSHRPRRLQRSQLSATRAEREQARRTQQQQQQQQQRQNYLLVTPPSSHYSHALALVKTQLGGSGSGGDGEKRNGHD